jgi:transcriptional regulator with XRE-family HTH domain
MSRKNYQELRKKMSPKRRTQNDRAVEKELRSILLGELRKLAGMTQIDVARRMGIQQSSLSRLESQEDMQVSTLQRIVHALGGKLDIIADLPDERVSIGQFKKIA